MNDPKDIINLLGIPAEKVYSFDYVYDKKSNTTFLMIDLVNTKEQCPYCYEKENIGIKGYYTKKIKNSVLKQNTMTVQINMRRFVCHSCNKTYSQSFPMSSFRKRISTNVNELIKNELKNVKTYTQIASEYDVSVNYVIKIMDSIKRISKLVFSKVICIDEFHFSSNHAGEKFPCVITNPYSGYIIDIIKSRRKEYLNEYFKSTGSTERNNVKYFITDMNETYRQVKKVFFPKATHIVDRFHIAKIFTETIQKIRIQIMKENEYDSKEYRFLKKNWKLFLMDRNKLSALTRSGSKTGIVYHYIDDVDAVLKKYQNLNLVYQAKVDFFKKGHNMTYYEAKTHIDFFINQFSLSPCEELKNIGNTLENWYDEIINAFRTYLNKGNLSNAIAEAHKDLR